jgi:ABC-type branched-subunit amino acid transport system substrate-binding protein
MQRGLQVYFDKTNAAGGVEGRTITLKTINDGYEPDRAAANTQTLIEKADVFALIGEVGTPTSLVAVPIAEENGVPFVGPFTGAEFLRNPYKPLVVNVRGSYFQEMERLAQHFVDEQGKTKVACFYQNDGYGKAGLTGIEQALGRRNMKLVSTGTYERNTIAINEGLASVAAGNPEVVIMVGAYKPCAQFIKSAKAESATAGCQFANISFVGTKNLLTELGAAADASNVVSQVVPYPWDTSIPLVQEYQTAMKAGGHGDEIGYVSLEGYMVGKLFCQALGQVQGEPTREKFLQAISATGQFDLGGVTLSFGPKDHQGMDQVFLTTFANGKSVPLGKGVSLAGGDQQ